MDELDRYNQCHAVGNGSTALRAYVDTALGRRPFDVIFMDLEIPVMDGLTSIDKIREYEAQHPQHLARTAKVVVATSVEDMLGILDDFEKNGVAICLKKLIRQQTLEATMAQIARSSEMADSHSYPETDARGAHEPDQHPA